jgi:predicted lipoprotein with Yx(FWY)xxD motif
MMRKLGLVLGALFALVLIGTALAADTTVMVAQNAKLGNIFTDAKGMTVYAFMKDTANTSNCTGGCLAAWPPVVASGTAALPDGVAGTLGTLTRSDGTVQVTYNTMPIYYFAKDKAPGDTTGQGVGGIWFVVPPGATFGTLAPAGAAAPAAAALPKSGGFPIELPLVAALVLLGAGARLRRTG